MSTNAPEAKVKVIAPEDVRTSRDPSDVSVEVDIPLLGTEEDARMSMNVSILLVVLVSLAPTHLATSNAAAQED